MVLHTGGLLLYASLVLSLFWLFQTASYFWVVTYPIHFRSFNTSGKIKAIHVTAVIVSFTLPTIPAVAIYFDEGYGLSVFAPNKCVTLSVDMFIYSFSVPLVTIVIFGISLLVATVWKVANVVSFKFTFFQNSKSPGFFADLEGCLMFFVVVLCVEGASTGKTGANGSQVEIGRT